MVLRSLKDKPGGTGAVRPSDRLWVLTAAAECPGESAAALLLKANDGAYRKSWQRRLPGCTLEYAALSAVVRGLTEARERGARRVSVLSPFSEIVDRLNRVTATAWDDPLAPLWIRARALSHGFTECEFRTVDRGRARGVVRMAEHALARPVLARAA
jgi:ribonuclease HI